MKLEPNEVSTSSIDVVGLNPLPIIKVMDITFGQGLAESNDSKRVNLF